MELFCPNCNAKILPDNVNISSDLAKCDKCHTIHKVSELAGSKSSAKIKTPLPGSRITMKKSFNDSVVLFCPKKGFTTSVIPQILFIIVWLGFISLWAFIAAQNNLLFALFVIPFVVVGIGMIGGLINSISETQTLTISRTSLTLKKERPIRPKHLEIKLKDIQSVRMKNLNMNSFSRFGNFRMMLKMQKSIATRILGIEIPAIISVSKTEYFFEEANDAEQEWVTITLDSIIKSVKQ